MILTHHWDGEVRGLASWPEDERPPMTVVFYTFRLMVALGMLILALGVVGLWLRWRGTLYHRRWFLRACVAGIPAGFLAILAGWFTTEVGRQPWVVYELLHRADAVSPAISGASVLASLAAFAAAYAFIFGFGLYYLVRLVGRGPDIEPGAPPRGTAARPMSAAGLPLQGGS